MLITFLEHDQKEIKKSIREYAVQTIGSDINNSTIDNKYDKKENKVKKLIE